MPFDGARVTVGDGVTSNQTHTDSLGHFELQAPAGSCSVYLIPDAPPKNAVRAPFFFSVWAPITLTSDRVQDLTLPPVVDFAVHVMEPGGTPAPGAAIDDGYMNSTMAPFELFPGAASSGYDDFGLRHTDAMGSAHISLFPTQHIDHITVRYKPTPSSPLRLLTLYNVTALTDTVLQVLLPPPQTVVLSGTLRDAYGMPFDGARVTVGDGVTSNQTHTDSLGHFELQAPAGSCSVYLIPDAPPKNPVRAPFFFSVWAPIVLNSDRVQDLTLPPAVDFAVQVTEPEGAPAPGTSIDDGYMNNTMAPFEMFPGVVASGYDDFGLRHTDSAGSVHITLFPTQRIDHITVRYQPSPSSPLRLLTLYNVPALADTVLQVLLPPPPTVSFSGTLRDAYGTPFDGARVSVGDGTTSNQTHSDSLGHFDLQAPTGSCSVYLIPEVPPKNPVRAPFFFSVWAPIILSSDRVQDLALPPVVDFAVQVTEPGGAPAPGASIDDGYMNNTMAPFEMFPGVVASGYDAFGLRHTDSAGSVHIPLFPTQRIDHITVRYQPSASSVLTTITLLNTSALRDTTINVAIPNSSTTQVHDFEFGGLAMSLLSASPGQGPAILAFAIPRPMTASLSILDIQGRVIACLADGFQSAGMYQVTWDTQSTRQPAGVYLARLRTSERTLWQRIVIAR